MWPYDFLYVMAALLITGSFITAFTYSFSLWEKNHTILRYIGGFMMMSVVAILAVMLVIRAVGTWIRITYEDKEPN